MPDFTQRFTGRASAYSKYRPSYPKSVIEILNKEANFSCNKIVADVGSGTGILSKIFLENGNEVFSVEPNDEMRSLAESSLESFPRFVSVKGSAENTTLNDHCIDLISVGQALHWFNPDLSWKEFSRIAKREAYLCVIYNDRKPDDDSGFMKDYDEIASKYSLNRGRSQKIESDKLAKFFEHWSFKKFSAPNNQVLDFEGLLGRLSSASYIPQAGEEDYTLLLNDVRKIFDQHQKEGFVTLYYETNVSLGRL